MRKPSIFKKFKCVVCGAEVEEIDRCYEKLDWCNECLEKDGKLVPRTEIPYIYKRPPYAFLYGNKIPEKIKKKILKERI